MKACGDTLISLPEVDSSVVDLGSAYGHKMVILVCSVIPLDGIQSREESDEWNWTALFTCLTREESLQHSSHTLARSRLDFLLLVQPLERWGTRWSAMPGRTDHDVPKDQHIAILIGGDFSEEERVKAWSSTHVQQLFRCDKTVSEAPFVHLYFL